MIDVIMNVLFPSVGGKVSKIESMMQDQTTSNECNFEQVLSIFMAQMGLYVTPLLQNLENSVPNDREGMNIQSMQSESSPFFISDMKNESLLSNTLIVDGSNTEQNISTSLPMTESVSESLPISNMGGTMSDMETKKLMLSEIIQGQEISNNEGMQKGTLLPLSVDSGGKELSSKEQPEIFFPDRGKLNLLYERNLFKNENGMKIQTLADIIRADEIQNGGLTSVQDKLHIKSVQLSTALSSGEWEESNLIKPGQIFQDRGSQKNSMELLTNSPQKFVELLVDTKQDLAKNVDIGTKGNVLGRVLETEWIYPPGEQSGRNAEQKPNLPDTNSQLVIPAVKSIQSGNEEIPTKTISISITEPKEVMATLTSLRSIVSEQIKLALKSETKIITIKLEPESLGALEVKVQEHSGKIGVELTTSNNDVHKVLSQSVPQLRESLKQEGILVKNIQVISSGTANLMLNQDFHPHTFSREMQVEPISSTLSKDSQPIVEENKPIHSYHDGTLNLWV